MSELIFNWWNIVVLVIGFIITYCCIRGYYKTKSRSLLNCLPGVWTSLGLLGTFCAICYSLNGLEIKNSTTLQEANVKESQIDSIKRNDNVIVQRYVDNEYGSEVGKTYEESKATKEQNLDIMKIISELIPAFTTSIIGLICALIVTLWAKYEFAKEEEEENDRLKNLSPEEYIRDIAINTKDNSSQKSVAVLLSELIKLQVEQAKKNQEYNDKLNDTLGNQSKILKDFIDGFVKSMDDIFKQMNDAIQQQVKTFGEEQFTKTSEVLTSISDNMSKVSTEIIANQHKSVETMMSNTNTELAAITAKVTEAVNKLTTELQGALTTLGTEQSIRLNSIITNYDALATKLSEQNSEFAQKMSETTSSVMVNTVEMNKKVTEDLRSSMSDFVTDLQTSITTQCSTLDTAISTNVESLNKAYQFIQGLMAEIRQNYDQSVLAYADAVSNVHRTNENTEKAITATSKSFEKVEATNSKLGEILDILESRQENIEQLTKQISSVSSVIVQLQKLETTLNKIVNK